MPQRVNGERRSPPSCDRPRGRSCAGGGRARAVGQALEAVAAPASLVPLRPSSSRSRVVARTARRAPGCSATRIRVCAIGERERVLRRRSRGSASAAAASRRSGSRPSCAVIVRSCRSQNDAPKPVVGELVARPSPSVAMRSIGGDRRRRTACPRDRVRPTSRAARAWSRPAPERDQAAVVQPPAAQVGLVGSAPVVRAARARCAAARARRARRRGASRSSSGPQISESASRYSSASPGAPASRWREQQRLARLAQLLALPASRRASPISSIPTSSGRSSSNGSRAAVVLGARVEHQRHDRTAPGRARRPMRASTRARATSLRQTIVAIRIRAHRRDRRGGPGRTGAL